MNGIAQLRALLFQTITRALDDLGVSSEQVVAKAGLKPWQFLEPDALVPGADFYHLLGHCARVYGEETFGVQVAEHSPLKSLGSVGRWICQSSTLYEAIQGVDTLVPRFQNTSRTWSVENEEGLAWFRSGRPVADSGDRQVEISTVRWQIDVVRAFAGSEWRPRELCLSAPSLGGLDRMEAFADAEIHFGRPASALAVPRRFLSRPFGVNAASAVRDREFGPPSEVPVEFVDSLRRIVQSSVSLGRPRIEDIAETAGLGVRALQRRLAAEGLTFKRLVDQARFQAAAELMGDPEVKLVEVALELGYSDQAHFTRAFRRWTGTSPGEFLGQLREQ